MLLRIEAHWLPDNSAWAAKSTGGTTTSWHQVSHCLRVSWTCKNCEYSLQKFGNLQEERLELLSCCDARWDQFREWNQFYTFAISTFLASDMHQSLFVVFLPHTMGDPSWWPYRRHCELADTLSMISMQRVDRLEIDVLIVVDWDEQPNYTVSMPCYFMPACLCSGSRVLIAVSLLFCQSWFSCNHIEPSVLGTGCTVMLTPI